MWFHLRTMVEHHHQACPLSPAFPFPDCRLIAATKDAEEARREKAVAENLMEELRRRCTNLEKDRFEALERLKESIEAVNIAKMQKTQVIFKYLISFCTCMSCCAAPKQADPPQTLTHTLFWTSGCFLILPLQALLREKQGAEVLEKTQECCSQLIRETPARIRKEVGDSIRRNHTWLEISTKLPPSNYFVWIQSYLDLLWTIRCLHVHFRHCCDWQVWFSTLLR